MFLPGEPAATITRVLLWLAQAQAPDAGGWTLIVTTWATGQRERAKWARETLAGAFFDFVDTSYRS